MRPEQGGGPRGILLGQHSTKLVRSPEGNFLHIFGATRKWRSHGPYYRKSPGN